MTNTSPNHRLQDKVILITGASDGIGKCLATACQAEGATVLMSGKQQKKLERIYDTMVAGEQPEPCLIPGNFAKATPEFFQQIAEGIKLEYGRLDALVHMAAHFPNLTPLQNTAIPQWFEIIQVNLNAPFMLTQALLPLLKASKDGKLIFTGDPEANQAYHGAYGVAKSGMEGLVAIIREELQENTNIKVHSVKPPKTKSSMRKRLYPGEDPQQLSTPEQVIPTYLDLLTT